MKISKVEMHRTGLEKYQGIPLVLLLLLLLLALVLGAYARPQNENVATSESEVRPGHYVPELYGAGRGKYMPDDSGKYRHIALPYDGGYGDRGLQYEPDARGVFLRPQLPFALGPRDHLRFMIDFNFNGTGWQIIQFEWIRDGEPMRRYNYMYENRLWEDGADVTAEAADVEAVEDDMANTADDAAAAIECISNCEQSTDGSDMNDVTTNVHVDAEYNNNGIYSDQNAQDQHYENGVQNAITEVLQYIQSYILPTLT